MEKLSTAEQRSHYEVPHLSNLVASIDWEEIKSFGSGDWGDEGSDRVFSQGLRGVFVPSGNNIMELYLCEAARHEDVLEKFNLIDNTLFESNGLSEQPILYRVEFDYTPYEGEIDIIIADFAKINQAKFASDLVTLIKNIIKQYSAHLQDQNVLNDQQISIQIRFGKQGGKSLQQTINVNAKSGLAERAKIIKALNNLRTL